MTNTSDERDVQKKGISVFCARLCTDRFDKRSLRSPTAALSEKDILNIDETTVIRGKWNNRVEFLLSCIGFAVGLGNVWRFPIRVYESGGGAFLIPYTALCFVLGVPMLMIELGLSQFSGRGPTKAFKLVPMLYGIGWMMVAVSLIIVIYYSVIIAWAYLYLFGSLRQTPLWTVCKNKFNSPKCLGSLDVKQESNFTMKYVSSTVEFWEYYVTGFYKYPSREIYTMNEYPGAPQWHLSLCLLLTWIFAAVSLMYGVKVSGKVMYFTVLYPYVALFALFCLGCTLPGALAGVKFYLYPDWTKIYQPKVLRGAVEQLFYSSSIAMGGMLTYASYNDFRDNFIRDAIIVIFADFLTSLLAGFAVFPILGYMAQRTGVSIHKVIKSGSSLFFITFTEALATLPATQFWTILLMIMAISLGIDSQFAMIEAITTGILDAFPVLLTSNTKKAIVIWLMCLSFFLCGLLLVSPGGKYWFEILDGRVSSYGLPLIALFECLCVGQLYGYKQFRYDFRMMTGYSLSWYWFIMIAYTCPIVISLILLASIVTTERIVINGRKIPVWGEVISYILLLILICPGVIGIIHTIVTYKKKYPDLQGKEFMKKLVSPPVYWGPYYKKNWLLADFYRDKLLQYKEDPRFLKYVSPADDLPSVIALAEQAQPNN